MSRLVIKTLLCALLATVAAEAQITTSDVRVRVTGDCSNLKDVFLVINGDDIKSRWVTLDPTPGQSCTWSKNLGASSISTSTARFSLRGTVARSDCRKATPSGNVADIEFACCIEGTPRNMSVTIEPAMTVSYVRAVPPFAGGRRPGIHCFETATFDQGRGAINQAQFEGENLYLQFGQVEWKQLLQTLPGSKQFDPKRQMPGLLLNRIAARDGTLVLTRNDVAYQMTVQRAKGQAGSAPTLSSNAISIEIKRLTDLKLERTRIEVIK